MFIYSLFVLTLNSAAFLNYDRTPGFITDRDALYLCRVLLTPELLYLNLEINTDWI